MNVDPAPGVDSIHIANKRGVAARVAKQPPEASAVVQEVHAEAPVASRSAVEVNPALDLLKKAHAQLLERRQGIEVSWCA
jgi:hypothetical protein